MSRSVRGPLLLVLGLVTAAPAAVAAEWEFDPVLFLGAQYNTNVILVGDQRVGDYIGVIAVDLPLTATTPRSSTTIAFTPTYYRYDEYSDLSYASYAGRLGWTLNKSQRTTWEANASATRGDRQTVSYDNLQQDFLVLPPTTSTSWGAGLRGTFWTSERHGWLADLAATGTRYESASIDAETDIFRVTNSTTTTGTIAYQWRISPLSQLETGYVGQYIDNNQFGTDYVHNLGAGYVYGNATEGWQFTGRVGAALLQQVDTGEFREEEDDIVEPVFSVSAQRQVIGRALVEIGARQDFTGANGLEGTSLVLAGYVGLRVPIRQYSRFGIAARYSDRNPIASGAADTETIGGNADLVIGFSPRWSLGFGIQYYDQTASSADPALDGTYAVYTAGLRWLPTAR